MKLQFLGVGSAFTMENFQSNMLLKANNKETLLIDCGGDIRFSLAAQGLTHKDVNHVYISHLHGDHCGGLEWLGFIRYFDPTCEKPTLYIHRTLYKDLWNNTLKGAMKSLQGIRTTLDTFFNVVITNSKGMFTWNDIKFQTVQTVHIMDGFEIVHSYGLMFKDHLTTIYITSDTQFCPEQIKDFYNMSDLIFHDCETAPYESTVHAHYNKLNTLTKAVKGKMRLYHYQDGKLPKSIDEGFLGFVNKGEEFNLDIVK